MKKLLIIFSILGFVSSARAQQQAICCPEFSLQPLVRICDKNNVCHTDPGGGGQGQGNMIVACKNQAHTYLVVPNLTGFTYTWTIIGGTPTSTTGNPVTITWGSSSQGFIQVIISNANGSCRDTIKQSVCLIDGPTANISASPNPACINQQVCFSSSGSAGAASYFWTFGDGSTSTLPNPCHSYSASGTYTVTLTVSSSAGGGATGNMPDCGCTDTAQIKITVLNKPGIDIHTDDCRKMLCTGDTVKYCTSTTGCSGLNWVVNGGTIINGQGTSCVTVVWNQPSTYPTTVTLNTTSCPSSVCGNSATLNVPVLYPNLPIQGPNIVCPNAMSTYFLPALPGTFYKWTISGGGMIMGVDSNHNVINVQWGPVPGGPYIITCNYNNPYSNCSGTDTIGVYIKPPFKINGPSPVCTGTPAFYNVMGGGNANWTVSPNTGFTPPGPFIGVPNIILNWSVAGNYTIGAIPSIPANYCTASDSLKIVVNPTPVLNPITGPNIICPNQLYSYSVTSNTSGGNFNWQLTSGTGNVSAYGPNNSNASVNFTGTGPWVLQASQTVNGCTGTVTLNITVVPPPPAITVSPNPVCSGGTVTATVSGAVPPGGYTWSSTPGAVLLTGQGTTTATFTVNSNATISISSCGGTSSVNVTTTATTVTITSVLGTCNAVLTASPGGGTYQWYLNGNPYGTGNPITVNQNGTYVVSATYTGGCKATNQIIVTGITPVTVSISGLGSLCNGGSVTLTASVSANCTGATYLWSNGATGNPISVNTAGSYSVTVTCSNGCTATSNIINVPACPTGTGNGNCINDAVISGNNNCNNPINLTATAPGCTPTSYVWLYGDGFAGTTGTHYYTNVGTYTVFVAITCSDGSVHCTTQNVTVPMVDSFTYVVSCGVNGWNVQLQDASIYLPSYAGYSILWTTTCGSLSANNIPNPTLTVPIGCNPTVTLQISKNGCTLTKSFTFGFPNTTFTINGNVNPCKDVDYVYSSSYTTGVIAYAWNFGDATTGVTNPITHHFNGTPPNPTISLTITDQWGCQFTATQAVNVIIPPALTITPSPIIKICPDCTTPTVTLTANPSGVFTNYQWYHNGTAITGANSSTYQPCQYDASGNYWVTANNTGTGNCPVTSDTVKVVYYPKPVANIVGSTIQCQTGTGPYNINLQNSVNDPNYTYFWTATGPGSVTFSPDNLQFYASATATQLGTYQFILTVTDTTTGCIAKDTMCVYLYLSPTVTVNAPSTMCEGTNYTFTATATPANPNYIYQWSNGATTPTITASAPGTYTVTVFDPASGCFGMAFAGTINKKPYLALFPLGCDTLCDTATLIPPLPLGPGQTYASQYIIKWYVDGNLYFTGCPLLLTGLSLGQHQIYIVVTDIMTGCTDTSGKYDLFIKHCGDCDCKESKWNDITLTPGETPPPTPGKIANVPAGGTIKLECNKNFNLLCNQTYTINAAYQCKDTACPPKVTYTLQPPVGLPVSGNVSASFTTTMNGVYILTLYGWCGDKICDSCVIDLTVKCDTGCDCKGSKWGEKMYSTQGATKPLDCNKTYPIKCNQPVTINANYICPDPNNCPANVTYTYQPPVGSPTSGNVPFTFVPTLTGTYTVTLYGWCGTSKCDSCVVRFKVDCLPVDSLCCPYSIKIDTSKLTYSQQFNATVAAQTFTISGLAGVPLTEVRAEVLSYTITDNYNKECMKCLNLPYTWASILSAGNLVSVPPKITMYNSTVHPFSPTGTGVYQNPREVVWNNGTTFTINNGTQVGMNFILPPPPMIDCCELKGRICVKFTFRDKNCKECEVISCFEFVIKSKK